VTAQRDLSAFFADLSRWAADGPGSSVHHYGQHPDQIADLREGVDSSRVAVVIHGGFWRAGFTRANTTAVAVALARDGWTTWNLEYRRVGTGGGYPQTLEDVATFCGSLVERPAVAIGHSTGAQLALWAAAEGLVGAAVALAGVCNLAVAAAAGLGEGAVVEFLGCDPAAAPDADPARRLPLATPVTLVHGDCDDRVPIAHAHAFAATAKAKLLELEGADHFDIIDPRARWWRAIETAIGAVVS
jgi:pimeloyl-ACP methyl ester carboxylesterase